MSGTDARESANRKAWSAGKDCLFTAGFRLVKTGHGRGDPTARRKGPDDAAMARLTGRHEVVQELVDQCLVEDTLRAVPLEIELQRLQLNTTLGRRVGKGDGPKVGLARLGAEAGELGTDDLNGVVASRVLVGERLQQLDRGSVNRGHCDSSK